MSCWERYNPQELLLFSEQVYWRLFLLHNETWWPWQGLLLALGAALIVTLARPTPARMRSCLGGLAVLWGFVAFAYLSARYTTINWAARYAVPIFIVEALLLVAAALLPRIGGVRAPRNWPVRLGLGLAVYAVFLHPLTALFREPGLKGAEIFGLAPDPLAIATLATLSTLGNRLPALALAAVPTVWLLVSTLTLYALGSIQALVPLGAAALGWAALLSSR